MKPSQTNQTKSEHYPLGSVYSPSSVPAPSADIRLIPLTQGKFAIVDADKYDWLSQWKWQVNKDLSINYAYHTVCFGPNKSSKNPHRNRKTIYMHRLILDASPKQIIDHINGDGLDNRKSNLRFCTNSENFQNAKPRKQCTSKYKGVSWKKERKKWITQIKGKYLGCFNNEIEAAKAYDEKAMELFGEFVRPNF